MIPHILSVVEPAPEPKMPEYDYVWNDTQVDIILTDGDKNEEVQFKRILSFFSALTVGGLKQGNVMKLMEAGYNTIPKIVKMEKTDFLSVPGVKEVTAEKLTTNIKTRLEAASLPLLMKASNVFGRGLGEKKMIPILEAIPDIFETKESHDVLLKQLLKVDGLGDKTAKLFLANIAEFKEFLSEINMSYKLDAAEPEEAVAPSSLEVAHPLFEKNIVISKLATGHKSLVEAYILKHGGIIGSNVTKKTFKVIVETLDQGTAKAKHGRALGILMTYKEFWAEYSPTQG